MITSIRLRNFKNFADETLRVGPFTILVGANASGKSNIRDAFRFLHGIVRGYTLAEIIGGKYGVGGQREWEPMRGAMNEIIRFGQETFSVEVKMDVHEHAIARFMIEVGRDDTNPGVFQLIAEELEVTYSHGGKYEVYQPSHNPHGEDPACLEFRPYVEDKKERGLLRPFRARRDRPALTQIMQKHGSLPPAFDKLPKKVTDTFTNVRFANTRFLELSPERMREPAVPGATILGDNGENLPVVLREIWADSERQETLMSWVQELTPMDVKGFEFPIDPSGRIHLMICEKNGRKVSSYSASDGTIRFLGLLAVLLNKNSEGLYFFEEIDSGIHPARQWLLLELIEKQTAKNNIQVITTTHAPDLLTFVNDSTFENMSVVCRLENSQDAIIRPVAELPNAKKLRTSQGGLGRLLTSRWMETALAFTEDYDEAEDDL